MRDDLAFIKLEPAQRPHHYGFEDNDDAYLLIGQYADGSLALQLAADGEQWATITVWVQMPPGQHLDGRCVLVKTWSENAGLLEEMTRLGWGEPRRTYSTGLAEAREFEFNPIMWTQIQSAINKKKEQYRDQT